jgi:hypothetical protein
MKHFIVIAAMLSVLEASAQAEAVSLEQDWTTVIYRVATPIALNAEEWNRSIKTMEGETQREQWRLQVRERYTDYIGSFVGQTEKKQLFFIPASVPGTYSPGTVLSPAHYFSFYAPQVANEIEFNFRKLNGGKVRVNIFSNKGEVTQAFINAARDKTKGYEPYQYIQLDKWFVMEQGANSQTVKLPGSTHLTGGQKYYVVIVESFNKEGTNYGWNSSNAYEVVELQTKAIGSGQLRGNQRNAEVDLPGDRRNDNAQQQPEEKGSRVRNPDRNKIAIDITGAGIDSWKGTHQAQFSMGRQQQRKDMGSANIEISKEEGEQYKVQFASLAGIMMEDDWETPLTFVGVPGTGAGPIRMKCVNNPDLSLQVQPGDKELQMVMIRQGKNGKQQRMQIRASR